MKHLRFVILFWLCLSVGIVVQTSPGFGAAPANSASEHPLPHDHDAGTDTATFQKLLTELTGQLSNTGYAATIIITGVGLILLLQVLVLAVQTFVATRLVGLIRSEIGQRNRPRVVVRHIGLEVFSIGKLAKVMWMAENMGNSDATLLDVRSTLIVSREHALPTIPEYDDRNHASGDLVLEAGRSLPFVQFSREDISAGEYDAIYRRSEGSVFFYGYLLYEDANNTRHRLGFCRQLDVKTGRFFVVDDPNYEYAD